MMTFRSPSPLAWALAACGLGAPALAAEPAAVELGEVRVEGRYPGQHGYRVDQVSLGPLGERAWLDTPYSLTTAPGELTENQQMKSVRDAFRYLPSVQGENVRPQTRGMQAGVVQNTRIDGLNISATTDYPIEQFERIEVLNGLSGGLYGAASPAGMFNYVSKRPTAEPLRRLKLAYASGGGRLVHVDLGDRLGSDGQLGYRLNLLDDNGEGYTTGSRLHRRLASLALDYRFTADTTLELAASRYHWLRKGFAGTFALAGNIPFPAAPDPDKVGYGQPYAGDDNVTRTASALLKHAFNPDWRLSVGVLRQVGDRASTVPTNTLTSASGQYTTTAATTTYSRDAITSNTLALNGALDWAGVRHELVFSNTGFNWDRYTPTRTGAITLGTATLDAPRLFTEPIWPDFRNRYRSVNTRQQALTIGDTLTFNPQWSAMLLASKSWIKARNYNKQGALTSQYQDQGVSTGASLMYKPWPSATLYVTAADSLQQGDLAPAGVANAGESLAPYRSRQWELGYKQRWGELNLGAALFDMQRPFAMTDANDNRYKVQGEQTNRGLELSAAGALSPRLSVYAGLALLSAQVDNTGNPATSGKQALGLARRSANLQAEYRLAAMPGLALNANLNYVGRRPGTHTNSSWVAGYTTLDVGARYVHQLFGQSATWRLTVNNLADRRYWANITPSSQNGYNGASSGAGTLGAPRTLQASLQVDF